MLTGSAADRFWSKVNKAGRWSLRRNVPGRCWEWLASRRADGYGQFRVGGSRDGRVLRAHRICYELVKGAIPEDLVIDHLCRNRACVNPDHLEPVSQRVNVLRGESVSAKAAVVTHCPKGHPYDAANTYRRPDGRRLCRTCQKAWNNAGYAKKRATRSA